MLNAGTSSVGATEGGGGAGGVSAPDWPAKFVGELGAGTPLRSTDVTPSVGSAA